MTPEQATWSRWKHRVKSFPFTCEEYDRDPKRRTTETPVNPRTFTYDLVSGQYDFIKRTACVVICNGIRVEGKLSGDLFK